MNQTLAPNASRSQRKEEPPVGGQLGRLQSPSTLAPAAFTATALAGTHVAKGAIIITEANIPAHQALGNQYPGALFATAQYNDGTTVINYTYGGVFIGRNDALGVSYFALPAHGLSSPFQSLTSVGFGTSISNPSGILPNVNRVYRGNFDPAAPNMTPTDLEIYSTTFHADNSMIRPIASSSPAQGDLLTVVSYGRVSTSAGRLPIYDGLRLGWNTTVQNGGALDVNDAYYTGTYFSSSSGISLNGGGNPRDSGAPAFNQAGEFVGMVSSSTAAANGGITAYTGDPRTTFLTDAAASGYNPLFSPYSGITPIPEPGSTSLMACVGLAALGIYRMTTRKSRSK